MVAIANASRVATVIKIAVAIACMYVIYKRISTSYKHSTRATKTATKRNLRNKKVCFATSMNQVAVYYPHSHLVYPLRSLAQYARLTDFEQQMKCG